MDNTLQILLHDCCSLCHTHTYSYLWLRLISLFSYIHFLHYFLNIILKSSLFPPPPVCDDVQIHADTLVVKFVASHRAAMCHFHFIVTVNPSSWHVSLAVAFFTWRWRAARFYFVLQRPSSEPEVGFFQTGLVQVGHWHTQNSINLSFLIYFNYQYCSFLMFLKFLFSVILHYL